ncbi:MAG TPA: phosphotransferase, partial [Acidimicrobiia bacterium]|nr:phosphotransferase [Acidimicrobiia bacterium]
MDAHATTLGHDRPYLARSEPLPRQRDDVTPQWLTRLLANRYPGIVVRDLETIEVESTHTTKVRLRWELNDVGRAAGIPETVCLKCNWSGLRTGNICELEARFYEALGSSLAGLVPATFYADWDDDRRGNGIVVMEDLALTPGAFGANDDDLGVDGVAAGLEALARIHAASWGDPRLESWNWLPRSMDTPNDTDQVILYWNYILYNLTDESHAGAVPAWVHESPERLAHALDELSAYEREHRGPACIVHGDAHQGNSFLRAGGQRIWLDWQMVRKGR